MKAFTNGFMAVHGAIIALVCWSVVARQIENQIGVSTRILDLGYWFGLR